MQTGQGKKKTQMTKIRNKSDNTTNFNEIRWIIK